MTLTAKGSSTFLTIFTNPYVWIIIGIMFLPLDILNYIILMVVNFIITLGNLLIFIFQIIIYGILNIAGALINVPIEWFNDLTIHIPVIDVDISLPDLPTIPSIDFPAWGAIPICGIEDVRIFKTGTILILYILELVGIDFPFG